MSVKYVITFTVLLLPVAAFLAAFYYFSVPTSLILVPALACSVLGIFLAGSPFSGEMSREKPINIFFVNYIASISMSLLCYFLFFHESSTLWTTVIFCGLFSVPIVIFLHTATLKYIEIKQ